jgi:hypothetical protein
MPSTVTLTFNAFGSTPAKLMGFFPSSANMTSCDLGSENDILEALARATREVATLLKPEVKQQLFTPSLNQIVRDGEATDGQTTCTLGQIPVVANTVHLWIRPLREYGYCPGIGVGEPYWYGDMGKPRLNCAEVSPADFSVNLSTGLITFLNNVSLKRWDTVYATYRPDTTSPSYSVPSLQDIVYTFAALDLGSVMSQQAGVPLFIQSLDKKAENYRDQLQKGWFVPAELLYLKWYDDLERNSTFTVKSVRTNRS